VQLYHRNRLQALLDATCAKIQALFQSSVPDESVTSELRPTENRKIFIKACEMPSIKIWIPDDFVSTTAMLQSGTNLLKEIACGRYFLLLL